MKIRSLSNAEQPESKGLTLLEILPGSMKAAKLKPSPYALRAHSSIFLPWANLWSSPANGIVVKNFRKIT